MPLYEYKCEKCQTLFLKIESFNEHDKHRKVKCPKCDSERIRQLISVPHVQTAKKS